MVTTELPSFEQFLALTGTRVVACLDGGAMVALTLSSVSPRSLGGGYESFSVQLQGPAALALEQGTFALRFDALLESVEPFEVFIVPTAERDGVRTYEAVFSRAVPTDGIPATNATDEGVPNVRTVHR